MRLPAGWRFTPGLIPTLATAALLPLLLTLGAWQIDRADFKRALIERMQARAGSEPVPLGEGDGGRALLQAIQSGDTEAWVFQPAAAIGSFDPERQLLLDNRTRDGKAGLEVYSLLRLAEGRGHLLVNRGWIALGARRDSLPDVELGALLDGASQRVTGTLVEFPRAGLKLGESGLADGRWPRVVQWLDGDALPQALAVPSLLPAALQLAPGEPGGYRREAAARTFAVPPSRHHGYAVQWFALAATLALLYLGLNLKRPDGPNTL